MLPGYLSTYDPPTIPPFHRTVIEVVGNDMDVIPRYQISSHCTFKARIDAWIDRGQFKVGRFALLYLLPYL